MVRCKNPCVSTGTLTSTTTVQAEDYCTTTVNSIAYYSTVKSTTAYIRTVHTVQWCPTAVLYVLLSTVLVYIITILRSTVVVWW